MNLYPAIDLYRGKVVRLSRGDFSKETIYNDKPEDQAAEWENQGAQWLHVVDLEGAKSGNPANLESVKKIRERVGCKIQLGGGMRDIETVKRALDLGIDRVVIGTKALDQDFLVDLLHEFKEKIALGVDASDGYVRTDGWLKESGLTVQSVLERLNQHPLKTVIYTDISKDGMLQGPNMDGLEQVTGWTKASVILSGGISAMADIEACSRISAPNFDGVIIGKALYENRFKLSYALEQLKKR